MYTKQQMTMICNFKLEGYKIHLLVDDTHAKITATKGTKDVLLFILTPEQAPIKVA